MTFLPAAMAELNPWSMGKAPSFRAGLDWLNSQGPIKLQDLKGKFVLLNFWTYGNINCTQILPDLERLGQKYPNELVIIGVHSAKFAAERETENIREAVVRYGFRYPVVNDSRMQMWRDYGIDAWPTVVLIDSGGNIIARHSGKGIDVPVDKELSARLKDHNVSLDRRAVFGFQENEAIKASVLYFPGKVLADVAQKRLFIADSGHNRILVTDMNGQILSTIANGLPGNSDGDFDSAQFRNPQGLALDGENLYVADCSNHLIRKVDMSLGTVRTIAGTGEQGQDPLSQGYALSVKLNSPCDLALTKGELYITMAGNHQIWALDLSNGQIRIFAGSGRQGLVDGALESSSLAQPGGLMTDGNDLYVVDSEASAVRQISLDSGGKVKTLIGKGLFYFGDKDGEWAKARLQHPLGIASMGNLLVIADTFNNKIKKMDMVRQTMQTLAGQGGQGDNDGALRSARFNEPAGVSYGGDKIFIADTNNHRVRVIDLKHNTVSTLSIQGVKPER